MSHITTNHLHGGRLKGYPGIMRRLAKEMDVMLIDVHQKTRDFVITIGDKASIPYYRWLEPGVDPFKPNGIQDDTHMMEKVQGVSLLSLPRV